VKSAVLERGAAVLCVYENDGWHVEWCCRRWVCSGASLARVGTLEGGREVDEGDGPAQGTAVHHSGVAGGAVMTCKLHLGAAAPWGWGTDHRWAAGCRTRHTTGTASDDERTSEHGVLKVRVRRANWDAGGGLR
jgi:hypothetical protein